jgi:hypothetical protein
MFKISTITLAVVLSATTVGISPTFAQQCKLTFSWPCSPLPKPSPLPNPIPLPKPIPTFPANKPPILHF